MNDRDFIISIRNQLDDPKVDLEDLQEQCNTHLGVVVPKEHTAEYQEAEAQKYKDQKAAEKPAPAKPTRVKK